MVSRQLTKFKILFKQNFYAIFIVALWFGSNFMYFWLTTGNLDITWRIVFFFMEGPGEYGFFYDSFTEFIIFGLVFSLITVELFRKYNPQMTCRELSRKLEDHVVIIGYSNIGRRLSNYLEEIRIPHVVIDKNLEVLDDLISCEEPVINDDALSKQTLLDAGVDKARAVFVMADNIEVQMVVNYYVREMNPNCLIVDRIFQDDIGELISKTYNTIPISTSKYAAKILFEKIRKNLYNNILIIGMNHISLRLIHKFRKRGIRYKVIENIADENLILGDPKELSIMLQVNVKQVDCVLNLVNKVEETVLITKRIREQNPHCKIICRVFLDSVAEMLEKPPFRCEIISSSKATLETLIKKGLLNF